MGAAFFMFVPLFRVGFTLVWTLMLIGLTGEKFALVLGLASAFGCILSLFVRKEKSVMLVLVTVFFACALFWAKTEFYVKPAVAYKGTTQTLTGRIIAIDTHSQGGANRCVVRISDGPLKGYKVRLSTKSFEGEINQTIRFTGKLYEVNAKPRDIYLGCYSFKGAEVTGESVNLIGFFRKKAYDTAEFMKNELRRNLPGDCSQTLTGMLIGEKDELSDEIYDNFKRAGAVHLLAVSGFHTSLWSFMVYRELLKRGVTVKAAAALSALFVLFFMAVTGFSKSAVRAGITMIVFFLGRVILKQSDSKNSLGLAATIILTANPFAGGDTGFLLSFFSTLGILVVFPPMQKSTRTLEKKLIKNYYIRRRVESVISIVLVTLATLIFTLPLTMLLLGNLSALSPLTNIAVTPLASGAILLSGLAVPLSKIPVLRAFEPPMLMLSGLAVKAVLNITSRVSALPFSYVDISEGFFMISVAATLILISVSIMIKADKKRTAVLSTLLFGFSLVAHYVVLYIEFHNYL